MNRYKSMGTASQYCHCRRVSIYVRHSIRLRFGIPPPSLSDNPPRISRETDLIPELVCCPRIYPRITPKEGVECMDGPYLTKYLPCHAAPTGSPLEPRLQTQRVVFGSLRTSRINKSINVLCTRPKQITARCSLRIDQLVSPNCMQ